MKIKRMLAMLLTLAMLFTMASPALAEDDVLPETNEFAELVYEDEDLEANEADDDLWEVEAADESGASLVEAPEEAVSEIETLDLMSLTEEGLEAVDEEPAEEEEAAEEEPAEEESVSDEAGMAVADVTVYSAAGEALSNTPRTADRTGKTVVMKVKTSEDGNWSVLSDSNKSIDTILTENNIVSGKAQLIYIGTDATAAANAEQAEALVDGDAYTSFEEAVTAHRESKPIIPVATKEYTLEEAKSPLYIKDAAGFNVTISTTAEGKMVVPSNPENGVVTYEVKEIVAKIGSVPYASLKAAVTAAEAGNTIELVKDGATITGEALNVDKAVTLNLGGKTLKVGFNNGLTISATGVELTNGTIQADSSEDEIVYVTGGLTLGNNLTVKGADGNWAVAAYGGSVTSAANSTVKLQGKLRMKNGGSFALKSGLLSKKPLANVCDTDFVVAANTGSTKDDYPYEVVPATDYVAEVDFVAYKTFAAAAEAAFAGGATTSKTITLLASISDAYALATDKTLKVKKGEEYTLTVNPAEADKAIKAETDDQTGVTTYEVKDTEAKIDDKNYASLADALAAANGGETVVLVKDGATITDATKITLDTEKNVTLDLDGKTLNETVTQGITVSKGKLTITNGTISANNKADNAIFATGEGEITLGVDLNVEAQLTATKAQAGGKVTVDGATVSSSSTNNATAFATGAGSAINVKGGSITSTNYNAISANKGASVAVEGGAVDGGQNGIKLASNATATVSGGKVTGATNAVDATGTTATISGGTITGTLTDGSEVSGGTFTVDPSAYVVEDKAAVKSEGLWVVGEVGDITAEIDQPAEGETQATGKIKIQVEKPDGTTVEVEKNVTVEIDDKNGTVDTKLASYKLNEAVQKAIEGAAAKVATAETVRVKLSVDISAPTVTATSLEYTVKPIATVITTVGTQTLETKVELANTEINIPDASFELKLDLKNLVDVEVGKSVNVRHVGENVDESFKLPVEGTDLAPYVLATIGSFSTITINTIANAEAYNVTTDTPYAKLSDGHEGAIEMARDGDVIQLLQDVIYEPFSTAKTLTLDLNKFTLRVTVEGGITSTGGELTITNGTVRMNGAPAPSNIIIADGEGKIVLKGEDGKPMHVTDNGNNKSVILAKNGGTVEIDGAKVSGGGSPKEEATVRATGNSTIKVIDGSVKNDCENIDSTALFLTDKAKAIIEGGTVSSVGNGIYNAGDGDVTVNGGNVEAIATGTTNHPMAIFNDGNGNVTVNGGVIKATGAHAGGIHNVREGNVTVQGTSQVSALVTVSGEESIGIYVNDNNESNVTVSDYGQVKAEGENSIGVRFWGDGAVTVTGSGEDAYGLVEGQGIGIQNDKAGTVNVTGYGIVRAHKTAAIVNDSANSTTGKIVVDGEGARVEYNGTGTGSAIQNKGKGTVEVKNGTVVAAGTDGVGISNESTAEDSVKVSGGTVTGTKNGIKNAAAGTVTVEGGKVEATGNAGTAILNNSTGTVTVKGGTVSAKGENGDTIGLYNNTGTVEVSGEAKIQDGKYGIFSANGTVDVKGGSIEAKSYGVNIYNGTLNVTDGTIKAAHGIWVSEGATVNFKNGEIEATDTGITNAATGTVNVTGGSITGATGILAKGTGNVTIHQNDKDHFQPAITATGDGCYAVNVTENTQNLVTIDGGAFTSERDDSDLNAPAADVIQTSRVSDANYPIFKNEVADKYCATDYFCVTSLDEDKAKGYLYTVSKDGVARVDGTTYMDFKRAMEEAEDKTVEMLDDVYLPKDKDSVFHLDKNDRRTVDRDWDTTNNKPVHPIGEGMIEVDDGYHLNEVQDDTDPGVVVYTSVPNAYTVEFDANAADADNTMAPQTFEYDAAQRLTKNAFTLKGYKFAGWNTAADGKGTAYADEAEVINLTIEKNGKVTLFAQWKPITYYVRLSGNADDVTPTSSSVPDVELTYNDTTTQLPTNVYTRNSYVFQGWNTKSDGSGNDWYRKDGAEDKLPYNLTTKDGEIITLYAIWNGNTYPVHFEPNVPEDEEGNRDYEGAMSDVDFVFGQDNDLPTNGFRRNGYAFAGWTTVDGGVLVEYGDKETVKVDLPLNENGEAVLYAVWERNVYNVEFDRNGENVRGETEGQEFTLGESKALNANGYTNEHYVFEGWSLKKNPAEGEALIADQANVKDTDLGNPKADDTVILYAQWKLEEFDITWKNDDGSKLPEATSTPDKVPYGERPVYPGAKNPESSHKDDKDFTYTFVGWKDKNEQLWTGDLPTATEDATYTAAYDVKSKFYTMSFMDDGKPLAVLTQAEGTPITPPANPTKDGYEFTGWKCTDTTVTSVPAKMPAKDLTFEAQWNKVLTIKDVRIEPQEYTGSALTPVETVTYQGQPLTKGTHYTVTLPEGRCVDVGEYDVTITGIGDYTGTVVAKFIIYPKGNIVVTAVKQTKKYGEPDPQLTYTVKIGDKTYTNLEPEAAKAVSGNLDREPGEDVGDYAITQGTLKGNPNYEITFVGNYLEITKADSFVIDEPIGKTELVYDGTDQPLVKAGTADGGMLQYSLDGVNFSTTIPTGNDAGTYPVYYKVEGDKNHSDTKPVKIEVKIAPKPVIVTGVKADDKVYDGSARTTITGTPIVRGLATGDIVVVMPGEANFIDGKAGYEKLVRYSGFTLTDVDAKNYVLQAQPAPTTANIIPKNVSLSWGDPELTYNGQYQAPEAKIEGVVEGDACSVKVEGQQKDVGEYTASAAGLTGKDKSNYKVVSTITTTPYTIGQKPVTITGLTAKDKVYDGNIDAVILGLKDAVIDGKESGDIVTAVPGYATFDDANVGDDKVVTFEGFTLGGRDAYNYILSAQPAAAEADITQKEVGLTWTDTEFVYDGKAHQPTATATGLVAGDTCEVKVTGAQTAARTEPYTATATSLSNPNYKLPADPTTKFTIAKKEVTITADAKTKVYGSVDPALTYTVDGLIGSDKLTGKLERKGAGTDAGENVGTYAIEQGTLKASDNYAVTYVGADLTITKKALTVKAAAKSKVYGDKDPEFTYSVSGLVKDDKVTGELEREPGENVGKYAIKQGTLTAGDNYDMTFIGADLTITQKDLTVVADAKSKTYGDKDPEFTYTVTGLVGFDEMTGALTREPGENVGTYAILQGTLTAGGNYKLHYTGANLTIGKKALKVKADAQSKIYGEKDPELTYSVEGLVSGDKLTGALTRAKGENVGTYAITQGSLAAGGNYNLSFTGSTLTISRKALTVKADAKSKTYGDKDPEFTYVATGLVGNETLTGALSRVSGENVGKYAIQQGTLKASDNYTLTFISADLTILPKKIVPTMDLDPERFVYDSQPKEPKVTVMDGDEEVPETEYTVEYEDNIEPGTGKARATSREGGNYDFDIEKTFIIEPAGPTELLLAKATTKGDTTIVYTWNKISEADGYEFYMSKCNANGKKYEVKLIKTIKGNKTFKFTKKNLKKGVAYKAKVMAYKMIGKKKVYLSESPMVHAYAGGKSKTETNAKTLTLKTTKFSLKKGKTGTIKATVTKAYSKLTLLEHTEKLRYYSSDTSIATVSDKGVITAKGKGTCTIAVLTHNGICKKVKVTVK